ncbi:hypothetical protein KKF34_15300 [Myxococcota bacterium]|nr:hypothetical protein [Myxococcota bacterium]MBU1383070.1 hypothetical protein [Myxococcota bacterium]MBU1498243.1 hypothetical protein [Myxococcota bacterium]
MRVLLLLLFNVILLPSFSASAQTQSSEQNSSSEPDSFYSKKKPVLNEMDSPIKNRWIFSLSGGFSNNNENSFEYAGVSALGLVTRHFGIETAIEINPGDDTKPQYESYNRISFSGVWFIGGIAPRSSINPYLKSGFVWQSIWDSETETTNREGLTLSAGGGFKFRVSQFSFGFEALYILPTVGGTQGTDIPGSFNLSFTIGFHASSSLWMLLLPIAFF